MKNSNELNMPSFLVKSLLTLSSIRVPDLIAVKSTSTSSLEHSSTPSEEHSNDNSAMKMNADENMIDNSGDINIDGELQCPNVKSSLTSLNNSTAIRVTNSVAVNTADGEIIDNCGKKYVDSRSQCSPTQICRDVNITTDIDTENVTVDVDMHKNSIEDLLKKPYMWWKKVDIDYSIRRATFLSITPFNLWLCDDPLINEQFSLEIIGHENTVKGERKRDSSHLQKTRKEKPISSKKNCVNENKNI